MEDLRFSAVLRKKRCCNSRGWIPIEAKSAFEVALFYYGTVAALMGPVGVPRPTPETILQVRIDGRVYRVQAKRAVVWANQVAERRIRAEERRR